MIRDAVVFHMMKGLKSNEKYTRWIDRNNKEKKELQMFRLVIYIDFLSEFDLIHGLINVVCGNQVINT